MARRVGDPAATLPEGVYEHLLTEELARDLEAATGIERLIAPLDDADSQATFARHVGGVVARALSGVPAARAHELIRKVLDHLAGLVDHDLAELVRDERPQPPSSRLLALHRGAVPERPTSPLATSTLLTRKRLDPTLGHELAREIATADEIDAIIAFVTVGGVRAIHDALHDFARRPAPKLRLLTTTFTGTTEVAALDTFARLPGAQVRVSYDTRRTRLHAKAWLFRRNTGLTTAYIGSAIRADSSSPNASSSSARRFARPSRRAALSNPCNKKSSASNTWPARVLVTFAWRSRLARSSAGSAASWPTPKNRNAPTSITNASRIGRPPTSPMSVRSKVIEPVVSPWGA